MVRCALAAILILLTQCTLLPAGEWMFRLREAHVQLRQALFDRDTTAAWEHVDRSTRQDAGILAASIRDQFDGLSNDKKRVLREKLGIENDQVVRELQAADLLVADFFLEAHPYLLIGDRDDTKLKDHGTRMAGPTGVVVYKKTPNEIIVPYRFTTEGHFGGQAMDYRAMLSFPSLDDVLEPAAVAKLTEEDFAHHAIAAFQQAQDAWNSGDLATFWSLLDCDSQSQANHFADQARQRAANPAHTADILSKLSISPEELAELNGTNVWALPWSQDELSYFANAKNPKFVTADHYDPTIVPVPTGYRRRDKPTPEAMIEFRSEDRAWQIPARLNLRNGVAEVKIFLRPPFYLRLRQPRQ